MFFDRRDILLNYYNLKNLQKSGKAIIPRLINNLFFKKNQITGDNNEIIWMITLKRNDYLQLFQRILGQIAYSSSEINISQIRCINFTAFISFFFHLYEFPKLRKIDLSIEGENKYTLSFKEQVMLYLYNLQFYDIVRAMKRHGTEGVNAFVSLCDTWNPENAIVKYLNKKGITTITCQHAVYRPDVTESCIDILNLIDVPSKIRLAWGDVHNTIFEKYSPGVKNILCGNPLIEANTSEIIQKTIGVATDYQLFKEYNAKLLKIVQRFAEENSYTVKWRKHPNDSVENYTFNKSIIKLDSNLDDCEFIVAHTTTMFFSYLARGIKAIRYKSDVPFFDLDESIQFSNQKEFDDIVRDIDNIDFSQISKSFIECIGEESKAKYNGFFSTLDRN